MITASISLTEVFDLGRGNKFRTFIFDLSFIPWIILTLITAGIAGIWASPYYICAKTVLFNDIYEKSRKALKRIPENQNVRRRDI